ncbi:hypothetical protein [Tenacibaculum sp. SDUM215027]|uniref:hypothetical protein n=1 Tax=Tenacibaculum sp. SDUM215027 TaxID=3422596 RepID=UPI003D315BFA
MDIAMMALYGDEYWNHPNYIKLGFDEYYEWENEIIKKRILMLSILITYNQ